jgi:hypothetical protein
MAAGKPVGGVDGTKRKGDAMSSKFDQKNYSLALRTLRMAREAELANVSQRRREALKDCPSIPDIDSMVKSGEPMTAHMEDCRLCRKTYETFSQT